MLRTTICAIALMAAGTGAASAQVACESMKGFIAPDVKITAAVGILIATSAHLALLRPRLAALRRPLTLLDAEETLAAFMVDGVPDARLFHDAVGETVRKACAQGGRVRAMGEMVAILVSRNNARAAVELEELWNGLAREHSFDLFCAYPLHLFADPGLAPGFRRVLETHDHVIRLAPPLVVSQEDLAWALARVRAVFAA